MKFANATIKGDFEQIKQIQSKWKNQEIRKEIKKIQKDQNLILQRNKIMIFNFLMFLQQQSIIILNLKDLNQYVYQKIKETLNYQLQSLITKSLNNVVVPQNNLQEEIQNQGLSIDRNFNFKELDGINFLKVYIVSKEKGETNQMIYFEIKLVRILFLIQNNMKNKIFYSNLKNKRKINKKITKSILFTQCLFLYLICKWKKNVDKEQKKSFNFHYQKKILTVSDTYFCVQITVINNDFINTRILKMSKKDDNEEKKQIKSKLLENLVKRSKPQIIIINQHLLREIQRFIEKELNQ
ncbi:unnamed protein product [Paramecium octaurelia]|uniref:Uncharacterized protein n=1 Tax=Paramecium octaurelia TaxID=43137 RepID=A0A8S1V7I2_PAROT|nr:unnamed protein product [Paramecium octaurelia]